MPDNILITGANRGIGLALSAHYAAQGARVIACCRQPSAALKALHLDIIEGIDFCAVDSAQQLAAEVSSKLDETPLQLLINDAGILRSDTLTSLDFTQAEQQFFVNALAPLRVTHALLKYMARPGKIALITSRMGSIADNSSGAQYGYRMSKAALNAAGKSLAHDLRAQQIAVALIHPGYVKTDMVKPRGEISPQEAAHNIAQRIETLSLSNSGHFWHANGEALPW